MCQKCGFSTSCKSSGSSSISIIQIIRTIILGTALSAVPSNSFFNSACTNKPNNGAVSIKFATVIPENTFADLTPAVDKFAKLPSKLGLLQSYTLNARGPAPPGPEPFGLVADELQPLSDYVRELVVSENPVLTMAASHFFDKVCKYFFDSFLFRI